MWLLCECRVNFVEIPYSGLQTPSSTKVPRRTQFIVVIQENKTPFLSSRLHLVYGVGEEEPTATFCQINYVNISGLNGNCRIRHTLNSYISLAACCLFVTEETNGSNLAVFWLQSRLVQEVLFQNVSHSSWPLK